jgi:hypothetical protein
MKEVITAITEHTPQLIYFQCHRRSVQTCLKLIEVLRAPVKMS